jgi:hypothetical protein
MHIKVNHLRQLIKEELASESDREQILQALGSKETHYKAEYLLDKRGFKNEDFIGEQEEEILQKVEDRMESIISKLETLPLDDDAVYTLGWRLLRITTKLQKPRSKKEVDAMVATLKKEINKMIYYILQHDLHPAFCALSGWKLEKCRLGDPSVPDVSEKVLKLRDNWLEGQLGLKKYDDVLRKIIARHVKNQGWGALNLDE